MSHKLLCQADDYGITDAVSAGIRKGIRDGLIRNTGLFTNMPSSVSAVADLDVDVCLGQDFNFVTGRPLCSPAEVPDLVDSSGRFRTSGAVVAAGTVVGSQGGIMLEFEQDPYPIDQVMREANAQYERFLDLVGKKPEYLHPHSLVTANTHAVIAELAERHGIVFAMDHADQIGAHFLTNTWNPKPFPLERQLGTNVEEEVLAVIPEVLDHDTTLMIAHPGFLDDELFQITTYTVIRMKDLAMYCSPRLREWVESHDVELVSWRDVG
ncbi:MAG: ChbG/HpnK family deacetylase [Propionicimonas sp.]|uniref:ChbG/HpnK family deacetylase n=1 Tax=Propionicimonas sp. TaxID=1955623 RepID=UPI003D112BAF